MVNRKQFYGSKRGLLCKYGKSPNYEIINSNLRPPVINSVFLIKVNRKRD